MSAAYSSTLILILTFFLGVISFPMTLPSHDNQLEARMPPVASARLNNLHLRLMRSSVSSSGEIMMIGGTNSKSKSLPIDYNKLTLETWALCIHMDCFTTAIDTKQTDPDKRSVPIFTHFDLPHRKGTKERLRTHDLQAKIDWETAEKKTEYFAKFQAVKFHATSDFLHGCVTILLQDRMLYTTDEKDEEKKTFLATVPEWNRLYQAMLQVEGSG